jgi:hypothetical protein
MSKHILFTDGILNARYDSAINTVIPDDAIEVDDALFFQTINEQDGMWSLVDGNVVKKPFPAKPLSELKIEKLNEIRATYEAATALPVEALGKTWDGGFDSAIKLDAALRLSQAAGAQNVTFYDTFNVGHELDFVDALTVCIAVTVNFQMTLAKKQSLFTAINAATSKTQLAAISW